MNKQQIGAMAIICGAAIGRGRRNITPHLNVSISKPKPPKLPGELRNAPCNCGSGLKGKNCNCINFTR